MLQFPFTTVVTQYNNESPANATHILCVSEGQLSRSPSLEDVDEPETQPSSRTLWLTDWPLSCACHKCLLQTLSKQTVAWPWLCPTLMKQSEIGPFQRLYLCSTISFCLYCCCKTAVLFTKQNRQMEDQGQQVYKLFLLCHAESDLCLTEGGSQPHKQKLQ